MSSFARLLALPVGVALVSLAVAAQPAHAQAAPPSPLALPGLDELVRNPGEWLTKMFNAALVNLGKQTTGDAVDFMGWLLGSSNVISQTPPGLSYDSEAVKSLWGGMRGVANAGLAVVTVWGGVNLMRRATHIRPAAAGRHAGALPLVSASNPCLPILQPSRAGRYASCPSDTASGEARSRFHDLR